MNIIISKSTNQPIAVEESFTKIREIIYELEFNPGEETPYNSENLDTAIATFDTLVGALFFWYIHEGGDECMGGNMNRAIQASWCQLRDIIETRDEEYERIRKLAMHGTEDPLGTPTQNGEDK